MGKDEQLDLTISAMQERLLRLEHAACVSVTLDSLHDENYRLRRPVTVSLRSIDDEWVASFFDAEISASGETPYEAADNLRDIIGQTFEMLLSENEDSLGPVPKRQLAVLREFIEAIPRGGHH